VLWMEGAMTGTTLLVGFIGFALRRRPRRRLRRRSAAKPRPLVAGCSEPRAARGRPRWTASAT
jgi:hypothetical protein